MSPNTLHLHRLIGLVERRGFHIDGLILRDEGRGRRVEMAVRGRDEARSFETLGRQVDRLFGVTRVAETFPTEVAV